MPKPWELMHEIAGWVTMADWGLWQLRKILLSLAETGEALSSNRDKLRSLFRLSGR